MSQGQSQRGRPGRTIKREIWLLTAQPGAGLQNLLQWEVGPVWHSLWAWKKLGRMVNGFVVLSSEKGWQMLGFRSEAWVWIDFGKIFPFALKLLKCAHHTTGLQSQHKHMFWRLSSSRDFGSGTCWLAKEVLFFYYYLDTINLGECNSFAYLPSPFTHAHIPQSPRVNPQDNLILKEKMWWTYLKIWIQEASVCLASARLQRADSRRWTFTEIKTVSFCRYLFSRLGCPPESGFLKAWGFLFYFLSFSAKINNIPLPFWGRFIKAIESASLLLLIPWVKDIWLDLGVPILNIVIFLNVSAFIK